MRIAMCDDDLDFYAMLLKTLERIPSRTGAAHVVRGYTSGDCFWFDYQDAPNPVDLIFLDIRMPGELDGLGVARKIRLQGDNTAIVLLTAYPEYALAGYAVHPFQYMLKPVNENDLYNVVGQVEKQLYRYWDQCLNVPLSNGFLRIPFNEILYMESRCPNVFVKTDTRHYKMNCKLDDIIALCDERFIYTHKSYAVNADRIKRIECPRGVVHLDLGATVPVSRAQKKLFMDNLMEYDRSYGSIHAGNNRAWTGLLPICL